VSDEFRKTRLDRLLFGWMYNACPHAPDGMLTEATLLVHQQGLLSSLRRATTCSQAATTRRKLPVLSSPDSSTLVLVELTLNLSLWLKYLFVYRNGYSAIHCFCRSFVKILSLFVLSPGPLSSHSDLCHSVT
jgi:hypothetical protein